MFKNLMAESQTRIRPSITAIAAVIAGSLALAGADQASAFEIDFSGSKGAGHTRYVPAISNPLFNETPFITTEIRPFFLHNEIPTEFLTGGGDIQIWAAQIRIALTDRLGFIATKDGTADLDFNGALPETSGLVNLTAGLKYAIISEPKNGRIVTVGAKYEAPTGDIITGGIRLQGNGDGFVNLFVTGAEQFDYIGLQYSAGYNIAIDGSHDTSMIHYTLAANMETLPNLFALVEFNGFTVIDDSTRLAVGFEGIDLVNFGATNAGTVTTLALGGRYLFSDTLMIGAGWESPLGEREDIMKWRTYVDLIWSF